MTGRLSIDTNHLLGAASPLIQPGSTGSLTPDVSSEFLNLLEQQLSSTSTQSTSNADTTQQVAAPASGTATDPGITPAMAQVWLNAILESLPVPGMDNGPSPDSTTGNPSSDGSSSFLSTMNLLQMMQQTGSGMVPSATALESAYGLTGDTVSANASGANPRDVQPVIAQAVQNASAQYGVPKNLIWAVIDQESGMDPNSVSPAGAAGLMQLMPDTARSLGVSNPFDPVQNVDGGTQYLASLLKQYQGNVSLALAAYNAGPGAVEQYQGIPPYAETQNYVKSVLAKAQLYPN